MSHNRIDAALAAQAPEAKGESGEAREACWKCDGRGKLRHNRMENGKYVFGFDSCDECGGTGYLLASKPADGNGGQK